jgi:DHA2 family multidrug resistance protein
MLGGWLTDTYSWRWMFYINLPVGALAVFLISLLVHDPPHIRATRPKSIDGIGFALLAVWLGTLQVGLDKGEEANWFSAIWLRWCLGISAVAMVVFIVRELWAEHPIVNLQIFRNRNFAVSSGISLLFGMILYALITLQPMFLQQLLGYNAFSAGLTMGLRGFGQLAALFLVGALIERLDQRILVGFGFLIVGISSFLLSRLNLQVAMSNVIPTNIFLGLGQGFIFVPLTVLAVRNLPNEQIGNATGIQNLLRTLGGGIGLSLVSTFLVRFSQTHQAMMVSHLSPLNPQYEQHLAAAQSVFATRFNSGDAFARAHAFIYQTLLQQASFWSFVNIFYFVGWLAVVCFCGVLFFKKTRPARAVIGVSR